MDAPSHPKPEVQNLVAEIVEGLREYQSVLVDSAGKVTDSDVAKKLYALAGEHAEMEGQLRYFGGQNISTTARSNSPFLNQIRSLVQRLRRFGDFSKSQLLLCEIIQTEDRMIRRFNALIDQISDLKWRRRLTVQLNQLLNMRDGLGRMSQAKRAERPAPGNHLSPG
ncbi:hypothetical protein AB1L30_23290 [Bremerella sp. JC817]|uniref:hypothetical protein n=1 Tax=Bremerella sp. JC817 TaxID=3231756 RepID=UPI003458BFDC